MIAPPKAPASSSTSRTPRRGRSAPRSPARSSPPTPPTPRSRAPPTRSPAREFEVAAHTAGPLTADALAGAAVLVIAHPSDPKWEATVDGGSPAARARPRSTRSSPSSRRRRPGRPRRDRAGQVRQQPQRAPRPLRHPDRERDRPGLRAPPRRRPVAGSSPTLGDSRRRRRTAPARPRSPASPPPASTAPARSRTANGARVLARTHADRLAARRAARRDRRPTARAASSSSPTPTSSATTASPSSTTSALWLNLVYWAAQPAFAAAGADRASAGRRRPRLDPPQGRGRGAAPDPGARRLGRHRPRTTPTSCAASSPRSPSRAQALKPRFPHQHDYIDALAADLARLGRRRLPEARLRPLARGLPPRARPPRRRSSTSSSSRCTSRTPPRDTCFEALIVRVPWPEWIAELERDPLRQRRSSSRSPSSTTPSGYDSECAVLFPETVLDRRAPVRLPLRRDLLRPRGRALPPRRRAPPPRSCASTCRPTPPACSPRAELSRERLHALGPGPRPHPHARRPALRPVHDPPAQPLLDVLARGAALRPHRVRRGRRARARGLRVRPPRPVRDPLRPPLPLPDHRLRACATTTASAASSCSPSCTARATCTGPTTGSTIEWDRVAEGVERLRERVQELYHSGIDRSKLGQWIAAHDLVAEYVPPAESSVWARDRRDLPEVEEPKQLVDLVRDDEFPLSLFYAQLQPKLEPALSR